MLLVESTDRAPQLMSCFADRSVGRCSGTQFFLLQCLCHVHNCVFLQCRLRGFLFFFPFCFMIKLQLSCRNVKNVKSWAAGLLGAEPAVSVSEGGLCFTGSSCWSLPRKITF